MSKPRRASRSATDTTPFLLDLLGSIYGLGMDGVSVGDLKIVSRAVQEMRRGFRVFARYADLRKVSTFGSARTKQGDPTFQLAESFSRQIAEAGFMVITGAGPGIMEACQRGAGRDRSFGMNIVLPFEQQANEVILGDAKLVSFRYFFTRKLFFVKEAHAVVLFPGGFGTHDEGLEALTLIQTGKSKPMPVIFLDTPDGSYWKNWDLYVREHILGQGMISEEDLALYKVTDDIELAVREITHFYEVYHSSRYVNDLSVIRLHRKIPDDYVKRLSAEFGDITDARGIELTGAHPAERDETKIAHLPRLTFRFDRTHFGRFRQLIDRINDAPDDRAPGEA